MRWIGFVVVLAWCAPASAQVADVDTLRDRAIERGWSAHQQVIYGRPIEVWCAAPPCEASRLEIGSGAAGPTAVRWVLEDADDGFAMDATWQADGAFGFRFTRGEDVLDLGWDLGFEHPAVAAHFSAGTPEGTSFEDWIEGELARYFGGPTSLREAALAIRDRLERNTARILASSAIVREGTVAECLVERATPEGHGFFDRCVHRRADAAERALVLGALRARLRRERSLLDAHFRAFSGAIRATLAPRFEP